MSLKHGVKFEPKFYAQTLTPLWKMKSLVSSLGSATTTKFVSCVFFLSCNKNKIVVSCVSQCLSKLRLEVGKKVVLGIGEVQKGTNQSQTYCKGSSVNTWLIDTHTHTHTHTHFDKFLYSMTHVHDVWIQQHLLILLSMARDLLEGGVCLGLGLGSGCALTLWERWEWDEG